MLNIFRPYAEGIKESINDYRITGTTDARTHPQSQHLVAQVEKSQVCSQPGLYNKPLPTVI